MSYKPQMLGYVVAFGDIFPTFFLEKIGVKADKLLGQGGLVAKISHS